MNSAYHVFGLVASSNFPILGLTPLALPSEPDLHLHLGASPPSLSLSDPEPSELFYASRDLNSSGQAHVRIWRVSGADFLRVDFDDGAQFWLDRGAHNLWAMWRPPLTLDDAVSYLLGPVFGLVLRVRGVVCLHSSAVSIGGRAVAFVGPQGAGKSTIAAAFASRDHAVLSDDIVALIESANAFHVLPAYPHLSLWPDSVEAIFGSPDAAPSFSAMWDKRRLALGGPRLPFENRALPLSSIFLLAERRAGPPSTDSASPRDALLALVANSYATNALDSKGHAKELPILGRLVSTVQVFHLQAPPDTARLAEVCECVSRIAAGEAARVGSAVSTA